MTTVTVLLGSLLMSTTALALDELGDRPARRAATVISTVTAMPTSTIF